MHDMRVLDYIVLRYITLNTPTEDGLDMILRSMGCRCEGRAEVVTRLMQDGLVEIGEHDELVATDKGLDAVIESSGMVERMTGARVSTT